jgi:hypothetical protein
MHDLEGVLLGDVEPLRDVGDLDQPVSGLCAVDQYANGVAGGFVEAHANPDPVGGKLPQRYVRSGEFGNCEP